MAAPLKLKIVLGSVREGRFSEKILPWVVEQVKAIGGFDYEVVDLRDYVMPHFDQSASPSSKTAPYTHEAVARWTKKIDEADSFLFIMPEYNRSVPGVLKNAIDWVYPEWGKKAVGFVGYGTVGGARAIEHARNIAVEVQMASVRQAVNVFEHWTLLDAQGAVIPGSFDKLARNVGTMLEQLSWWAAALKEARKQA